MLQALQQRYRRQDFDPSRRQLNGQRESADPADNLGDRGERLGGEPEIRPDGLPALEKELDRAAAPSLLDRGPIACWQRKRGDRVLPLSGKPQSHPAGGQDRHAGAGRKELVHLRASGNHLLEVVQDQQQILLNEHIGEAIA